MEKKEPWWVSWGDDDPEGYCFSLNNKRRLLMLTRNQIT